MAMPGTAGLAAANGVPTAVTPVLAAGLRQAAFAGSASRTPVERVGAPADVAEAIGFLIRDSFVTGRVLTCDGGLRLMA